MPYCRAPALLAALLVSGCYWEPPVAEILVDTVPPGASCVVSQLGQPLAVAEPTPAIAIVPLTGTEVGVLCRRPGFADAEVVIPPPPPAGMPGFVPSRRPDIGYETRVDVTMIPAPPR